MSAKTAVTKAEAADVAAPAPATESAAIIQMIERAARDPNVDIDKMERLFAMRERMQARDAEAAFNASMAAAQAELKPVAKNAYNEHTKSKYAALDAIAEAIDPIIHKHGFGCVFGTFESAKPGSQGILIDITHAAGHSKQYRYDIPVDAAGAKGTVNKTPTHAYGSTLTYGRRYAKVMTFDVATTAIPDDDGNAAGTAFITDEQATQIRDLIDASRADIAKFCAWLEVDGIAKIPTNKFRAALDALEAKRRSLA